MRILRTLVKNQPKAKKQQQDRTRGVSFQHLHRAHVSPLAGELGAGQGQTQNLEPCLMFVLDTQNPALTPASQPELNTFKMDSKETDECFPLLGLLEITLFQKIQSRPGLGGNSHCSPLPALHICWNFLPLRRREHESGSVSTQTLLHLSLRVTHR